MQHALACKGMMKEKDPGPRGLDWPGEGLLFAQRHVPCGVWE